MQSKKPQVLAIAGLLTALTTGTIAIGLEERGMTLDQVPTAVRDTILRESAGAKITEIEEETKDGTTVYEAEFVVNGDEIEIRIAADGTLMAPKLEHKRNANNRLSIDQLPEQAKATLIQMAGDALLTGTKSEIAHGVTVYESAWRVGDVEHEAVVTADGLLVEMEESVSLAEAPDVILNAIANHFGADTAVVIEKKMIVVYEIEAKVNGSEVELLVFPTGRVHQGHDGEGDDDDDGDDDNDDDSDDDDN